MRDQQTVLIFTSRLKGTTNTWPFMHPPAGYE
jgi:hypothetical protein